MTKNKKSDCPQTGPLVLAADSAWQNKGIRLIIIAKLKLWNDIVTMIIDQTFYRLLYNCPDSEVKI
jgi:hypothetical protein